MSKSFADYARELQEKNKALEARELEINAVLQKFEQEAQQLISERTLNAAKHQSNLELFEDLVKQAAEQEKEADKK